MPKYDERFARQYRYEPPPGFPLLLPFSGIVHHLSGPNAHALTQTCPKERRKLPQMMPAFAFTTDSGIKACELAFTSDSLVRVSRRVRWSLRACGECLGICFHFIRTAGISERICFLSCPCTKRDKGVQERRRVRQTVIT